MPRWQISTPDDAQEQGAPGEGRWRISTPTQRTSAADALLSGAGDAISFGWGDELQGALFGPEARDAARTRQELARADQGGWFLGGQALGSLVGGGVAGAALRGVRGGAALLRGMGPISRIGAAGAAGAVGGAAYGAGDAGDEQRLEGAVQGILPGAVGGAAGQAVLGEIAPRIFGAAARSLSPEARSADIVGQSLNRFGMDDAGLRRALQDAPDNAMLMDVVPGGAQIVRGAAARPGLARDAMRTALDNRNNAMGGRAIDDLWTTLGPGNRMSASATMREISANQQRQAKPLYDAVMERPIDPRRAENMLGEIVRRNPALFRQGRRDALELMRSEHGTVFNLDDPRYWHYLQQGADQVFERLRATPGGLSGNQRRLYGRALDAYRIQLRRLLGPEFGRAQDIWSSHARARQAVEYGFDAVKQNANDLELGEIAERMRRMTPGERQSMQVGALAKLSDMLENADTGTGKGDVLRALLRSQGQRRVLQTLFRDRDIDSLIGRMDAQRELFRNSALTGIDVNSITADKLLAYQSQLARTSSPSNLREAVMRLFTQDAADRYDESVSNRVLTEMQRPARDVLADMQARPFQDWQRGRGLLSRAARRRAELTDARPRKFANALAGGLFYPVVGGGAAEYGGY